MIVSFLNSLKLFISLHEIEIADSVIVISNKYHCTQESLQVRSHSQQVLKGVDTDNSHCTLIHHTWDPSIYAVFVACFLTSAVMIELFPQ